MAKDARDSLDSNVESVTYHVDNGERPSEAVVRAVHAAVATRDPNVVPETVPKRAIETGPPLYHVIDPEALDSIFRSETHRGRVTFTYRSCDVTVDSDGRIEVRPSVLSE